MSAPAPRPVRRGRFRRVRDRLRYRPGLRWLLGGVAVVVVALVALGALAAYRLRSVVDDLRAARDSLQLVQNELQNGQVARARQHLAASQARLAGATDSIYSAVPFAFIGWIPVVHQNLAALRHSVGLAYTVVSGGAQTLANASSLQGSDGRLDVSLDHGGVPLQTLAQAEDDLVVLANELPIANQQRSESYLFGPVKRLQREVFDEAVERRSQVVNLARGVSLLNTMAGVNGPRRYLIAVANTAEERGTGGMILSYGELDAAKGRFSLGSFGSVDDIPVPKAPATTLPEDYRKRWYGIDYLTNWRQANLGADFTEIAPTLANMYTAATNLHVDGVIQIDPAGLAAILAGTGPVEVPGVGTVTADNVVELTLHQSYLDHPDRSQRQDDTAAVAKAAFSKLLTGSYPSLRPLGTALAKAVAGRHLLFWSSHPDEESDAEFFDADGALPAASAPAYSLVTENISQNKLDYFLHTSVKLSGSLPAAAPGKLDATLTLANAAPADGTNRTIFGPNGAGQQRGVYRGIVSFYVPVGTTIDGVDGDPVVNPPAVFSEGGHEVISYEVAIPAGGRSQVVLHLKLKPRGAGAEAILLVPQARVVPTTASVEVDFGGAEIHAGDVTVDRSWLLAPGAPPVLASGPDGLRVFASSL